MKTPTQEEIKTRRALASLTQHASAALVRVDLRTWQKWEGGERKMHPGFWHLFLLESEAIINQKNAE